MSATIPFPASSRRAWLIAMACGPLAAGAAQALTTGSGRVLQETRPLADIVAIAVAGPFEVAVRQAARPALSLSGDDNLLPLVETVVEAGRRGPTLHIRLQRGASVSTRLPIRVTVDVVKLEALSLAGSGQARVDGLKSPSLALSVAGSAEARLDRLGVDRLDVGIAGSGHVHATGKAGQLKLSISGSGDADLKELVADEVSVSVAGSGDADITAQQSLSVSVAGSGDVTYGGAVGSIRQSVAGSGKVRRR